MALPARDEAMALLREHTQNENLIKHMLAVEAAMRAYARKLGGDEDLWGIVGLLHDFDYEKHPTPEEHPAFGARLLEEKGYPPELVYAIRSHGSHLGLPRIHLLDRVLFAVDELTGFIVAVVLMQPTKKLADLKVESVLKKMRQKGFARNVSREDIEQGAKDLGVPLQEHVAFVVRAMSGIAGQLGL